MRKKKLERDIVVLWINIDDDVITNLKFSDDYDECLNIVINAFKEQLEQEGKEIFYIGNTFLICEDNIYLAIYEDEWDEEQNLEL